MKEVLREGLNSMVIRKGDVYHMFTLIGSIEFGDFGIFGEDNFNYKMYD